MKEHPKVKIGEKPEHYNWLPDFVYGGIDGAVTTFAVVAGVQGAALATPLILILGFANLFADGFSMSVGKYLSDKSHREQYERIREIEFRHLKEKPHHEKKEVEEILALYGFKGKDLTRATEIVTSDPEGWVDIMMRREFNMTHENTDPLKGAATTFLSFVLIGFIPLFSYLLKPLTSLSNNHTFVLTSFLTLAALFFVGTVKSRFSAKSWIYSGLQTSIIGGAAASIAYFTGYFLKILIT